MSNLPSALDIGGEPAPQPMQEQPTPEPQPEQPQRMWDERFDALITNKGWKKEDGSLDYDKALTSYEKLESHMGVGPDRLLRKPNPEKPEEVDAFWREIGRPESADKYEFDIEGASESDIAAIRDIAFKHNLTAEQAQGVFAAIAETDKGGTEMAAEELRVKWSSDLESLKKDWGEAYDQNREIATKAMKEHGIDEAAFSEIAAVVGLDKAFKLMHSTAPKSNQFVSSEGDAPKSLGIMTPAEAQAELQRYLADPEVAKRILNPAMPGHKEAREKRRHLMTLAEAS